MLKMELIKNIEKGIINRANELTQTIEDINKEMVSLEDKKQGMDDICELIDINNQLEQLQTLKSDLTQEILHLGKTYRSIV